MVATRQNKSRPLSEQILVEHFLCLHRNPHSIHSNSGAAYVFTRSAGVWAQQAYLKASNAGANHNFGGRVAVLGDLLAVSSWTENSDGIGINGEQGNSNAPLSGAVYLFTRSGGMWTQKAYLKASNSNADYEFGVSLALSGDSLAVGAYREDSSATGMTIAPQIAGPSTSFP